MCCLQNSSYTLVSPFVCALSLFLRLGDDPNLQSARGPHVDKVQICYGLGTGIFRYTDCTLQASFHFFLHRDQKNKPPRVVPGRLSFPGDLVSEHLDSAYLAISLADPPCRLLAGWRAA